jgi:hypothetical protein
LEPREAELSRQSEDGVTLPPLNSWSGSRVEVSTSSTTQGPACWSSAASHVLIKNRLLPGYWMGLTHRGGQRTGPCPRCYGADSRSKVRSSKHMGLEFSEKLWRREGSKLKGTFQ